MIATTAEQPIAPLVVTGLFVLLAGLGGGLGGTALANRAQRNRDEVARAEERERERREDQRRLRDAKRERLRAAYTELLVTARLLRDRADRGWILAVATEISGFGASRDQEIREAFADLERQLSQLLLESDVEAVVAVFEAVRTAYAEYGRARDAGLRGGGEERDRQQTRERFSAALQELDARVPELEAAAREHLRGLEQPI